MCNSKHTGTWGVVLLVFGVFALALSEDRVPDRSSLKEIAGQLRSLEKSTSKGGGLSAVRFSLTTDPRHFSYHSTAGQIDDVWEALNQAGHLEVRVLKDPAASHTPPLEERSSWAVLEVIVGKKTIRSYSEVIESLRSNNLIGVALGYGTGAMGAILLVAAFLRRRQDA
jgi:hypothetical protein